ncbi:hypothetical protein FQA39_LY13053 [Lamprigera yunnana]|nr:hypothetical protein FQA39_LY13053 [Lamprigera yunnana]
MENLQGNTEEGSAKDMYDKKTQQKHENDEQVGRRYKNKGTQSRYQVKDFQEGGALLRIEPVKAARDDATYECVAENGVGDAVSAEATLTVFEVDNIPSGGNVPVLFVGN